MVRKARKWNPALHPRDSKGRFTRSATRVLKGTDGKRARAALSGIAPAKIGGEADARAWMERRSGGRTPDPQTALGRYLAGGWRDTNKALRASKTPPPEVAEIDAEFGELDEDVVLRRQVPLQMFAHIPVEDLVGMKVRDAAYASTSIDRPDAGPSAPDAVTMHIAAPAGTPAYVNAADGEVLLGRDTEIAVTRAEPNGRGGWDLYGVVIPKTGAAAGRGRRRAQDDEQTSPAPAGASSRADAGEPAGDATDGTGGTPGADGGTGGGRAQDDTAGDGDQQPTGDRTPAAGTRTPDDDREPAELPDEGPLAAFTPVDRERIRVAVEDHAARIFRSPLVGGSKDDVARYTAEGPLSKLTDREGLSPVWKAVAQVIDDRPELLDRTPEQVEQGIAARAERVEALASEAAKLTKAGNTDRAMELIDQAELIAPDHMVGTGKTLRTRSWGELRDIVRRRAEQDRPARTAAQRPAKDADTGQVDVERPADAETAGPWIAPATGALAALAPIDRERVRIAVEDNAGRIFRTPMLGGTAGNVARYTAEGRDLSDVTNRYGFKSTVDAVSQILADRPDLMQRSDADIAAGIEERRAVADAHGEAAGGYTQAGDYAAARAEVDAGEAIAPDWRLNAPGPAFGWAALRRFIDEAERERAAEPEGVRVPTPINDADSLAAALADMPDSKRAERAVRAYRNAAYGPINQALRGARGGQITDERVAGVVADIDALMARSETTEPVTLYRGVGDAEAAFGEAWTSGEPMTGSEWTDHGYASTSTARSVAEKFGGDDFGVVVRYNVPAGVPALGFADNTAQSEQEVILGRGLRYRVTGDRVEDGARVLDVDIIAPGGDQRTGGRAPAAGTRTPTDAPAGPAADTDPDGYARGLSDDDLQAAARGRLAQPVRVAVNREMRRRGLRNGPAESRLDAAAGDFDAPEVPDITADMTGDQRRAAMGEVLRFLVRVSQHLSTHERQRGYGDYYVEEIRNAYGDAEHARSMVTNPYEPNELIPARLSQLRGTLKAIGDLAQARARRAELTRSADPDPANNPTDAVLAIDDILRAPVGEAGIERQDKHFLAAAAAAIEGGMPISQAATFLKGPAESENAPQRLRDLYAALTRRGGNQQTGDATPAAGTTTPSAAPSAPAARPVEVYRLRRDQYVTVTGRRAGLANAGGTFTGYVAAVSDRGNSNERMVTLSEYPGGYGRKELVLAYYQSEATPAPPLPDSTEVVLWKNAHTGRPAPNPDQASIVRGNVVRDPGREKIVRAMLAGERAQAAAPAPATGDAPPAAGTSAPETPAARAEAMASDAAARMQAGDYDDALALIDQAEQLAPDHLVGKKRRSWDTLRSIVNRRRREDQAAAAADERRRRDEERAAQADDTAPPADTSPSPDNLIAARERLAASIASGVATREELTEGSTALVERVMFNDGREAIFKRASSFGGRSAREQQDAEELGALVLAAFGVRSPAVHRDNERAIYADFVEGRSGMAMAEALDDERAVRAEHLGSDAGRLMAAADVVMGNIDRNSGNFIVTRDGELVGIDHGLAFYRDGEQVRNDTGIADGLRDHQLDPADISPADLAFARARLVELRPEFERLNRAGWHDATMARLDALAARATGTRNRIADEDAPAPAGDTTGDVTPAAGTSTPTDAPEAPEVGDWAGGTYADRRARLDEAVASGIADREQVADGDSGFLSEVEIVTFANGDRAMRKTVSEGGLGRDLAETQDAEELAAALAAAVGAPVPAVHRGGPAEIYVEFIDGRTALDVIVDAGGSHEGVAPYVVGDTGRLLGLADLLTANTDRHNGNWMITDDGEMVGIDHGLAWWGGAAYGPDRPSGNEVQPFSSRFMTTGQFGFPTGWADHDFTPADMAEVRRRLEALRPEFDDKGRGEWIDFSLARLDALTPHAKGGRNLIADGDDTSAPASTPAAGTRTPDAPGAPEAPTFAQLEPGDYVTLNGHEPGGPRTRTATGYVNSISRTGNGEYLAIISTYPDGHGQRDFIVAPADDPVTLAVPPAPERVNLWKDARTDRPVLEPRRQDIQSGRVVRDPEREGLARAAVINNTGRRAAPGTTPEVPERARPQRPPMLPNGRAAEPPAGLPDDQAAIPRGEFSSVDISATRLVGRSGFWVRVERQTGTSVPMGTWAKVARVEKVGRFVVGYDPAGGLLFRESPNGKMRAAAGYPAGGRFHNPPATDPDPAPAPPAVDVDAVQPDDMVQHGGTWSLVLKKMYVPKGSPLEPEVQIRKPSGDVWVPAAELTGHDSRRETMAARQAADARTGDQAPAAGTSAPTEPTHATIKGHGSPETFIFYGVHRLPEGRLVRVSSGGRGRVYLVDAETGEYAGEFARTMKFWAAPAPGADTDAPSATRDEEKRRKDYERGWNASRRNASLERADDRAEPDGWYDGYHDQAAGRAKWASFRQITPAQAQAAAGKLGPDATAEILGDAALSGAERWQLAELVDAAAALPEGSGEVDVIAEPETPAADTRAPISADFDARIDDALRGEKIHPVTRVKLDDLNDDPYGETGGYSHADLAEALETYKGNDHEGVNRALRDGTLDRDSVFSGNNWQETVERMDAAIAASPLPRDAELWRGILYPQGIFGEAWNDRDVTGLEFSDAAYTSTSTTERSARNFAHAWSDHAESAPNRVVMRILAPVGTRGVSLGAEWENEILLERGLRFRVVRDSGVQNNVRRLDVEVVGPDRPSSNSTGDTAPAAGTSAPDAGPDGDEPDAGDGGTGGGGTPTPTGPDTTPTGPAAAAGPAEQVDIFGGTSAFVPAPRSAIGLADRPDVGRERAIAQVQQLGMFDISDQRQMDGQMAMLDALLDMPAGEAAAPPPGAPTLPAAPDPDVPDTPEAPAAPAAPASIVPEDLSDWSDEQLAELFRTVTDNDDQADADGAARIFAEWDRREASMAALVASVPDDLTGLPEDEVMGLFARLTSELGSMDHPTVERVGAELDRRQEAERIEAENAPKRALLARPLADLSDEEIETAREYASDLDDIEALERVYAEWERRDAEREAAAERERIEREAREEAERQAAIEAAQAAEREAAAAAAAAQRDRMVDAMAAAQDAAIVPAYDNTAMGSANTVLGEDGLRALLGDQVVDQWIADLPDDQFGGGDRISAQGHAVDRRWTAIQRALITLPTNDRIRVVSAAASQAAAKEFADYDDRELHTVISQGVFSTEPLEGPAPVREKGRRAGREQNRRKIQKLREDNAREFRQYQIKAMAADPATLTDAELEVAPALVAATPGGEGFDTPGRLAALRAEAERREIAAVEAAEAKAAGPAGPARYLNPVREYGSLRVMVRGSDRRDVAAQDRLRRAQAAVYGLPEDADAKAIKAAERKDPRPYADQAAAIMAWFRHLGQYEGVGPNEQEWYRGKPDDPDAPDTPAPAPPANVSKPDEVWQQILDNARQEINAGRFDTAARVSRAIARTYRIPADGVEPNIDSIRRLQEHTGPALHSDNRTERVRAAEFLAQFRVLAAEDGVDPSDSLRYGPPDKGTRRTSRRVFARESTPEQERRIDELVARGWDWLEAYAEVHGVDRADVDAELRRGGRSRMKESEIRAAYAEYVHAQYLAAEAATSGYLLSKKAIAANARREARGEPPLDPRELFSGPWSKAQANASEELKRWWADNPRLTYADFKAQLTGEGAAASRDRLVAAGKGNEFA